MVTLNHSNLQKSSNTLDLKSNVTSNTGLLCEEWLDAKSDTVAYTKSANSPSPTNYSGHDGTPHDFTSLSPDSMGETQNNINTVHHSSNVYTNIDNYGPVGMISTPSMSISGMDSMLNGLDNDLMDISTIMCDSLNDGSIPTARTTFYDEDQEDFDYAGPDPYSFVKERLEKFFISTSSKSLTNVSEDWGIDRSVNTVYSRSGFLADCFSADNLFHGEYLSTWGMHNFAECRMPLIFCIILTDKDLRKHQGYSPIAPLAINLLDRFMAKQSSCLTKIVHLVYDKLKSYKSDKGNPKSSSGIKDSVSRNDSQESDNTTDKSTDIANKSTDRSNDEMNGKPNEVLNDKTDERADKVNGNVQYQTKGKVDDLKTNGVITNNGSELKENGASTQDMDKDRMIVNMEVVYNLVALACYFIADRYNGLVNVSLKTLIMQWAYTCRIFRKTRYGAYYISKNKHASLHAAMCAMFEVYSVLDYVVTVPFVSQMVQTLIVSSNDIPCSQNPTTKNLYQNTAYVLARIALIDDTFHKFCSSTVALSIYSLVRKLAEIDNALLETYTWLEVDETNIEIKECKDLLMKTLSQFVNTDVLDAVTQPVNLKGRDDDIFTTILLGDTRNMDLKAIKRVATILSK
ncbi:hypothetical protein MACK_003012 [Theileria orientalis]|uniref:Cyclin n=1 Tax=Theileria orientalis TaxID=68886 RepID=A0A976MFD2_THEOR|nr:hypothetical protein MACK_003012 [Theileria orientalis]